MMLRWFKFFALLVVFAGAGIPSFSLESDGSASKNHFVERIVFIIDGHTSPKALRKFIELNEGDSFSSELELREYASKIKQDLINYRVFKYVTMDIDPLNSKDAEFRWMITYGIKDSWTLIPIPYPKYDSNTGLRLGLKTYYNNAFGSMTDLYLGLGMDIRTNSKGKVYAGEWVINPRWSRIKIGPFLFNFGYTQSYNEEEFDSNKNSLRYSYSYYLSEISLGSSIKFFRTPFSYSFGAAFLMKYQYKDMKAWGNFREDPFQFRWNHGLGYGRIDWKDNFRTGESVGLGHKIGVILDIESNQYRVANELSLSGSFYRILGRHFNFYANASSFIVLNGNPKGIGPELRGIKDNTTSGMWGIYGNLTMAIQFWDLEGIWDAQVHPFVDFGLSVQKDKPVEWKQDFRIGAGIDLVLYLDALPNLVAKGTIGVDLTKFEWSDIRKYEFLITSSLHY